jgi:hypothetical protein
MKRKGFSKLLCGVFAPLLMVLLIVLIFSVPVSATVNSSNIGYTLYTSATSDDVWENEATITTNAQPGMVADGAGSVAHNNANVVTTGDGAFGMYALNTGTVLNHAGGLVRTNGEGSHGMVADGTGSTATNEFGAEVRTTGPGSFGMLATGGSVATNLGRVVTTSDDSHGMYAFGGSTIYNTNAGDNRGVVRTEGAGSHGMVADGSGSTAHVNSSNVVTNGDNSFGMYALNGGLVYNHFGGLVRTNGTGSHGMVADGAGSRATNEGDADVLTTGDGSFGMFATNGSEAENLGRVVTRGDGSHGMYAFGGSTVNNNGSGAVRTEGAGSHGMVADGAGSVANNRSSVLTIGDGSFGMYALDGGEVINRYGATIRTDGMNSHGMVAQGAGAIATNETEANIRTTSDDAYGMYALDGALARNSGTITTLGDSSHGMVAENGSGDPDDPDSGAYNNEMIVTSGDGSYGMYALNSSRVDNYDTIETRGEGSHGMVASGDSWAYNFNDVTTYGSAAFGMYALNGSFVYNYGTESIETWGAWSHGMVADGAGSVANNRSSVLTIGDGSFGMYALDGGEVINRYGATIRTDGMNSHGMVAQGAGAIATNETEANIRTTSDDAYGMYALDGALARNSGTITTLGDSSHGMVAENGSGDPDDPDSGAYNNEMIVTSGDGSYGMYALNSSRVDNYDTIETRGEGSHGMVASGDSWAYNFNDVTTYGSAAFGMYALNGSFVYNYGTESIETWGAWSHGMVANVGSYAYNDGSIITHGGNAYGMAAVGLSSADNYGDIVTGGSDSYGMLAWDSSEALNAGSITTTGDNAWGMLLIEGSTGTNNGTITTTGIDSHAVRLDDSDFINTGTLDSAQGFAVAASNNSNVTLLDDTVLAGSRVLADLDGTYDGRDSLSGTSTLTVDMDADIDAVVAGFGEFTKRGDGTMLIEAGSWAGDTRHEAGMLKIEGMTQFVTETYDQEEGARLYLYANPFSATDPDAIPLWVSGDAWMDGSMRADMTSATGVGFYNFIRATYYEGEPVTTFENLDPLFLAYGPAWVDGWDNDYHYRTLLGYSFSEAALGLVAAVDDWNMLRWIMGNHLQDVAESMKEMEVGEKKIHAHALGGTTSRDPADSASAGFDSTQKGISVGFDKKSNDNTVWGLYAGYTEKDIDFTGLPMVGSDWESQDTWHIGGYISKKWDRWIFSNTLTFRSTDHKTFRVQMGGDATASFDSWAITNDLRLGYVAKEIGEGSNWQVIPEVGLNVGYFDRGGYTEKNGFTYGDFDTTVVESVLGVRFRGEYERANGSKFVPQARLAWVHVLSGGDITIDQSWGGTTHWFTEYLDDDYFVADLGLSLYNMNDMDISLNYGGRFSDNSTTHGGWLRLEWRF